MKNKFFKRSLLFFVVIFIVFSGYFLFQLKNYLSGPKIFVNNLKEWNFTDNDFFEISGTGKNILNLSINGRKTFLNENGYFKENFILANGMNYIEILAEDKFGHKTEKTYYVIYQKN